MELFSLVMVAVFILLGGPILAIIAFVRVSALERIVGQLNRRFQELGETPSLSEPKTTPVPASETAAPPALDARPPVTPAPKPTPAAPPASAAPPAAPNAGLDLETLIAGRWLNRVGIIALLVAVIFFLMYAIDNDWIGPRGQIALGLLSGTGLLVFSQWLLRRGYGYFSGGMAGLAAGVLYASLYAAWSFYQLLPQPVAFAGMIVVTGTMVAIALGRDSQPLALLAQVGGLLTPILLSTGKDAQVPLFIYLAVLNGGLLVVARLRSWRSLELVAFAGTTIYFWAWIEEFYKVSNLGRTAFFATLFFVQFAAVPIIQSRRLGKMAQAHVILVLANAGAFLGALQYLLYRDHRWALTCVVLALAAAHLGAARLLPVSKSGERSASRLLFAGLALTFVTLAIPIRLDGKWITIAWAVEGAVLIWSGFQVNQRLLRWAGIVLFVLAGARLLLFKVSAHEFLWNPRFLTYAIVVASFAAAFAFSRRHRGMLSDGERRAFEVVGLAANVLLVSSLSMEVWGLFGRMRLDLGADTRLTQQMALSLLWTLYATGLMLWGVRSGSAAVRWLGLALFSVVVVKVFLYDLSFLERVYRIASFAVLGVLLVVVSFFYQRRAASDGQPSPRLRRDKDGSP